MRAHYEKMLLDGKKRALRAMKTQNIQQGSPYYGAFVMENGVYMQKHALYCLSLIHI